MSASTIAPGAGLDWNATSTDYLRYRPGYPESFFELAFQLGVGRAGQRLLDLGAGTGALALQFARQSARVVALDASENQLGALSQVASRERLEVQTLHARAEATGLPAGQFDAITASMCWGYFDQDAIAVEVPRLLKPGGVLLVSSLIWTSDDPVAKATDGLIAAYNPASSSRHRREDPAPAPSWLRKPLVVKGFHTWVEGIPFSRESWRGRIRASKWIGAALSPETVAAFDREHDDLLRGIAPDRFVVPHRITLHTLAAKD